MQVRGNVCIITLSEDPLNILSRDVRVSLRSRLDLAVNDTLVKCIVLTGSSTAFSVGADINEFISSTYSSTPIPDSWQYCKNAENHQLSSSDVHTAHEEDNLLCLSHLIDTCPKPCLAFICGYCFGGGLELALACHYRIGLSGAQYRFPETLIGLQPGAGGTQLLPRFIPFDLAIKMCFGQCLTLSCHSAMTNGLIDQEIQIQKFETITNQINFLVDRINNFLLEHQNISKQFPWQRSSTKPLKTDLRDATYMINQALAQIFEAFAILF